MMSSARFAACAFVVLSSAQLFAAKPPKLTPAETKAAAILRDVDATMKKHKTMTADFVLIQNRKKFFRRTLALRKPNLSNVISRILTSPDFPEIKAVSDGKYSYFFPFPPTVNSKTYSRTVAPLHGGTLNLPSFALFPVRAFFDVNDAVQSEEMFAERNRSSKFKLVGERAWQNVSYSLLQKDKLMSTAKGDLHCTTWLYIGNDNIVHRQIVRFYNRSANLKRTVNDLHEMQLSNIKTANVPDTAFQ